MTYVVNEQRRQMTPPVLHGDTFFVPMTPIAEALGGAVSWEARARSAVVTIHGMSATVRIGEAGVDLPGGPVRMSAAARVENDMLMVPMDFFSDVLGCSVSYNREKMDIRCSTAEPREHRSRRE